MTDVIRPLDNPLYAEGATRGADAAISRRDGCVIKPAAAEQRFLQASRPGDRVRRTTIDMARAVDRDDLDVTPDHVLVLQERRPEGRAGHAGMGHAADPEEAAARPACATWCAFPTRA